MIAPARSLTPVAPPLLGGAPAWGRAPDPGCPWPIRFARSALRPRGGLRPSRRSARPGAGRRGDIHAAAEARLSSHLLWNRKHIAPSKSPSRRPRLCPSRPRLWRTASRRGGLWRPGRLRCRHPRRRTDRCRAGPEACPACGASSGRAACTARSTRDPDGAASGRGLRAGAARSAVARGRGADSLEPAGVYRPVNKPCSRRAVTRLWPTAEPCL